MVTVSILFFFALYGATVYGIDITTVGIDVAKKIAETNDVDKSCFFSVQNASNMNFPDEKFDIVIMHEVLHHAIKYPGVKQEIMRVLKKGGTFIAAESIRDNPLIKIGTFFTMRGLEEKGDVALSISNLKDFSAGFSSYEIELFSLLFMSKRIFRDYMDFFLVRWFLYFTKKVDDLLLDFLPALKKYCLEVILVAKK